MAKGECSGEFVGWARY